LGEQNEDVLADYRCNKVGFVFQSYNLISTLTVAENIAFPLEWKRTPPQDIQQRVAELLETLGLQHRANHFPAQLSGGEQQRVAFARALAMTRPCCLRMNPQETWTRKNGKKSSRSFKPSSRRQNHNRLHPRQRPDALADLKYSIDDGKLAVAHD
jgi:predicted ABC-type transport system involved in lysophospholipase L1 biosynthesis ATPase subunit